jgi:hypothetical protein
MKQTIILTISLFFWISCSQAQQVNWKQTRHWKIYALNKAAALSYPADTLNQFKHIELDDSTMSTFLSEASLLPKKKYAAWMGFYMTTYETPGHDLRKVILSNYGGFFFDSFSKRYYELPESLRDKWYAFISGHLDRLFEP